MVVSAWPGHVGNTSTSFTETRGYGDGVYGSGFWGTVNVGQSSVGSFIEVSWVFEYKGVTCA